MIQNTEGESVAGIVTKMADRVLARIAPRVDAAAGCTYEYTYCYCIYRVGYYAKKCMYGCPGVPNHCSGGCVKISSC